jgi:hypothetical protein
MRLETLMSCQDNSGYVWIAFASALDAETFLTAIAQSDDDDLGYKAREPIDLGPQDRHRLRDFQAPEDSWLIAACTHTDDDGDVTIWVSIRFPREQLARVMSALG